MWIATLAAISACGSGSAAGGSAGSAGSGASGGSAGSGGGGWGPCSLKAAGHPGATSVTLRVVDTSGSNRGDPFDSCDAGSYLFQTPVDYEAFVRARLPDAGAPDAATIDGGTGDAAASGDGGTYAGLIDWSRESLLVVIALSSAAFSAGIEGDTLVLAAGAYCQGAAPSCEESAYAVPKVARLIGATCPPPGTPCLAP